jgi:urease gamma subunit
MQGEIRFNKELCIFQGFDGNNWINFRDNLVLNEQLQIPEQIAAINTSIKEYKTKVRQVENLMIDAGQARDKLNKVAEEYHGKLHDKNPSVTKNYPIVGNVIVGQAVVLVGSSDLTADLAVSGFTYSGKSLNSFNERCNIAGIVESVLPDGTCNVVIRGPVNAKLALQSTVTEFQKSSELKNGILAILDYTGCVYQPARKPLSDFIQIGFILENTSYSITEKMVKIWVEPSLHIL